MKAALPQFFRPIFWSHDFTKINPKKHKSTIIINTINYGGLEHWKWLARHYGTETIRTVLTKRPSTEIRPQARRLAEILFDIQQFSHVPRSSQ